jgi:hypothetical protein
MQIFIITLDFEKNANFFAENWQKSQKILIITSTPAPAVRDHFWLLAAAAGSVKEQRLHRCRRSAG